MFKKINKENSLHIIIFVLAIVYVLSVRTCIRYDRQKRDKIDKLTEEIEELKTTIKTLEDDFSDYRSGTKGIIDSLSKQIKDLADEVDVQIDQINNDIDTVKNQKEEKIKSKASEKSKIVYTQNTDGLTASSGVNYYGDQKETYYNLNMNGVVNNAQANGIEGDYWIREDGVKMYGDYVIIAANQDVYSYGSTVETSLGTGIVLDTGGFASENPTQVDIATDW